MTVADFLLAFVGIIIGLGVADLLTSLHKLLSAGRRVKWNWATPTLAALLLLVTLVIWFRSFGALNGLQTESVAEFLPVFLVLVFCFLMMAAALPDEVPEEGIDLKQFYCSKRIQLWSLMSAALGGFTILYFVENWSIGVMPLLTLAWPTLISISLAIAAARTERMWVHGLAIGWIFSVLIVNNLSMSIGP